MAVITNEIMTGRSFLKELIDRGVVPPEVRRVVIDAPYDDIVMIYYEGIGTVDLLGIDFTGATIKVVTRPEAGGGA